MWFFRLLGNLKVDKKQRIRLWILILSPYIILEFICGTSFQIIFISACEKAKMWVRDKYKGVFSDPNVLVLQKSRFTSDKRSVWVFFDKVHLDSSITTESPRSCSTGSVLLY